MYKHTCKECGKEFESYDKKRVYCSRECNKIALKRNLSARQKDLTNKKFGKLTALYSKNKNGRYIWFCKCECGNELWVNTANLINGHTKSCGCSAKSIASAHLKKSVKIKEYREKNFVEGTNIASLTQKKPKNNTSGVKGVYWDSNQCQWIAKLRFKGKTYKKGFKSKEKAIQYRKSLEEEYFQPILDKYKDKS